MCIIAPDSSGKKIPAKVNIKEEMLDGIELRTDEAARMYWKEQWIKPINTEVSSESLATTERFRMGNLKGKTPVDVLLEYGDKGKEMLNNQYEFLKEKTKELEAEGKNALVAGNKKMMQAIIEASKLDLSSTEKKSQRGFSAELMRITARPLIREKREDGKCFCYEATVTLTSTDDYPVNVQIKNFYAPVKQMDGGLLNIMFKETDQKSVVNNEMKLSVDQWLAVVKKMVRDRNEYETISYGQALKTANTLDRAAREAARRAC